MISGPTRLRRRALGLVLPALVGIAGCSGSSPAAGPSPSATSTSAPSLTPNDGRILSAIEDGAVLHGLTGWQVSPRFPEATEGEPVVQYFIDGVLAWRERHEPYRFQGDDAQFDTRHLTNGPHTLSVTATYPSGQRATFTARVTVKNNGPILPGPYTDYGYNALVPNLPGLAVDGIALAGRWLMTFPSPRRLKLSPEFAEPLEVPMTTRPDGSLLLRPVGCPSLQLVPQIDAGAVRFGTVGRPSTACRAWATLLADRSWAMLPG